MGENGFLQINKKHLDDIISFESKKIVGKILKRFEICNDTDFVKKETKELIYEGFRDLKDLLYAYDKGLEISIFKFKQGEIHSTPKK